LRREREDRNEGRKLKRWERVKVGVEGDETETIVGQETEFELLSPYIMVMFLADLMDCVDVAENFRFLCLCLCCVVFGCLTLLFFFSTFYITNPRLRSFFKLPHLPFKSCAVKFKEHIYISLKQYLSVKTIVYIMDLCEAVTN